MSNKKIVKSIRLDKEQDHRISQYAQSTGLKESDAIRDLINKGLACESLTIFATPVGHLIQQIIEAEFALFRSELDERDSNLEERLTRISSRGTKASLHVAMQLNDLSRTLVPAWQNISAKELFMSYSKAGGTLQAGYSFDEAKAILQNE